MPQLTQPSPNSSPLLTVLGRGAWGTALANLARINNISVQTWSRRSAESLESVVGGADVILCAISMKGVAELASRLRNIALQPDVILVTATKGLDPATKRTPSQIWQATFPQYPVAVLSGPNLSQEIEQGLPAATVIACEDLAAAETVRALFASETFRVYTNADPLGTELGGTLKNVIAIAVGVCDGLKLGTNARSALITRALPEVLRLGTLFGGQAETFYGLSGLGDLLATCTSPLSRNYRVGYGLAQGKALEDVLVALGSTAEGVNTTYVLIDRARDEGISAPIAWQVYRLLKGQITPQEAVTALMARDLKSEYCDSSD